MKLRYKLILAMLFVAVAPLGIAGYQALENSRTAVEERIRETLAKTSRAEAEIIGRDVAEISRSLRLVASAMEVETESLSSVSASLERVYLLSDRFNAAAVFDAAGNQVGPTIFVDDRASFGPKYQSHEEMNDKELKAFLEQVEKTLPESEKAAQSKVYVSKRKSVSLVALLMPVVGAGDIGMTLAVELSLDPVQKRFERFRVGNSGFAFLVDAEGKLVFHPDLKRAVARQDQSGLSILQGRLGTTDAKVSDYHDPLQGDMLGAFAPVPESPWAVVVAQPKAEALEPVKTLATHPGHPPAHLAAVGPGPGGPLRNVHGPAGHPPHPGSGPGRLGHRRRGFEKEDPSEVLRRDRAAVGDFQLHGRRAAQAPGGDRALERRAAGPGGRAHPRA
jgi:hypothetical protein